MVGRWTMAFKKTFSTNAPIILGSSKAEELFPPGFRYRIAGTIYTVKADVTQEAASPMREVIRSDGSIEIIPIESIMKDLKEPDCEVMDPDARLTPGKEAEETPIKKVPKKKKTAKKTKKETT